MQVDVLPPDVFEDSEDKVYIMCDNVNQYYEKITIKKPWNYHETIPYMHVLQRIEDLFTIDVNGVDNGDIYFVADVSDYYEYDTDVPYYLSNYFKLKNKFNASEFSSWVNIPIEGSIPFGTSCSDNVTVEDYRHAKHLEELIPSLLYNNPHCGYGRYDLGEEYMDYLRNPYKYSVENYMFDDDYYRNMAMQFKFVMSEHAGDKCEITADTYEYGTNTIDRISQQDPLLVNENHKYLKITLIDNGNVIGVDDTSYRMHLEYMRNVVMRYVVQVVPSTTLLVLENFVPAENVANDTVNITVVIMEEDYGIVYGTGTYLKSTMVNLKAVPNEGYHFVRWTWNIGRTTGSSTNIDDWPTDEELTVMACGDVEYTAWFAENCGIGFGCEIVNCSTPPADY